AAGHPARVTVNQSGEPPVRRRGAVSFCRRAVVAAGRKRGSAEAITGASTAGCAAPAPKGAPEPMPGSGLGWTAVGESVPRPAPPARPRLTFPPGWGGDSRPNTPTLLVVPTNTSPSATVGVMNFSPFPKWSREPAWLLLYSSRLRLLAS